MGTFKYYRGGLALKSLDTLTSVSSGYTPCKTYKTISGTSYSQVATYGTSSSASYIATNINRFGSMKAYASVRTLNNFDETDYSVANDISASLTSNRSSDYDSLQYNLTIESSVNAEINSIMFTKSIARGTVAGEECLCYGYFFDRAIPLTANTPITISVKFDMT